MTVTLGDLTNEILAITNRDSANYTTFVQNSIVTAINYMQSEHPYAYEKISTITITDGNNAAILPADFSSLIYAEYSLDGTIYNSRTGFLNVSYPVLLSYYTSLNNVGIPTKYAIYGGSFYVYPYTNGDTTFTLSYYYTDTFTPAVPTDTSIWFGYLTLDCIRSKAIENFYRYALQTPDVAEAYATDFNRFLQNLRQSNNAQIYNMQLSI